MTRTTPLLLAAGLLLATAPLASARRLRRRGGVLFKCVVGDGGDVQAICLDPGSHESCLVRIHNGWIDADICPGG